MRSSALVAVLFAAACGGPMPAPEPQPQPQPQQSPPAPVISSFTATPAQLPAGGGRVTLAWAAADATGLSIDHGVGDVSGQTSASVQVASSTTFTLTATGGGKTDAATVTVAVSTVALWPPEGGPDLTVPAGITQYLQPGSINAYRNCRIDGTVKIDPSTSPAWTVLGCSGDLVLNGTIVADQGEFAATGAASSLTAPVSGETVQYSTAQSPGGSGGKCGASNRAAAASDSAGTGNGAGGDGDTNYDANGPGHPPGLARGGDGGEGSGNDALAGGEGAAPYGQPGAIGTGGYSSGYSVVGGGGGGGSRGAHGLGLYIKVAGNVSGTGSIDVRGQPGGEGGHGGFASGGNFYSQLGGGGGGGGAGGSGGAIVLRVHGAATDLAHLSIHLLAGGGAGGAGGDGGIASGPGYYNYDGQPGGPGSAGADGTTDVKAD